MVNDGMISYTVSALRMANRSNAVSKLHAKVSNDMWKGYKGVSKILAITNAQSQHYWQDEKLKTAWKKKSIKNFNTRKTELKKELFAEVYNQTGKEFDPDVLTIVWARRLAGYKRADLLLHDIARFNNIMNNQKYPVQIIWAGKPYPFDYYAIDIFNHLVHHSKGYNNLAVLIGYELELSRKLKLGSDVWLNTPRITREASGTSGMSAAMNGSVNVSVNDGWIQEFEKNGVNCFVLPKGDHTKPVWEQDRKDAYNLYDVLEQKVIPTYYDDPTAWHKLVLNGLEGVIPEFTSERMAKDYYTKLYK